MMPLLELLLKFIEKFNCVKSSHRLDAQEKDMVDIKEKIDEIENKLESYYNKEYMHEIIATIKEDVSTNEKHIEQNHNLLYQKHEHLNEKLHEEIKNTSVGIAELKCILHNVISSKPQNMLDRGRRNRWK